MVKLGNFAPEAEKVVPLILIFDKKKAASKRGSW